MRPVFIALISSGLLLSGTSDWTVTTHAISDTPRRVRLALLDGDERPDLVFIAGPLTFKSPNLLAVWRNLGDGRFERHWSTMVLSDFGQNGVSLEVADMDENGLTDLILGNAENTGGFTYRAGDGSGSFPTSVFGPSFGGYVDDVSVADYNSDDHLDVATTTLDLGFYVDRFAGHGDGSFDGSALPFDSISGPGPVELASTDLTGDGRADDVVTNAQGLRVLVSGGGSSLLSNVPSFRAALGDFDGDGLADIASTAPFANAVQVLHSLGGGAFGPAVAVPAGRRPTGILAFDLDLDGDLDLGVTNSGSRSVSLLENPGDGSFVPGARLTVGSGPTDLAAADLDGDGDNDMVVANAGDDSLSVLLNPLH